MGFLASLGGSRPPGRQPNGHQPDIPDHSKFTWQTSHFYQLLSVKQQVDVLDRGMGEPSHSLRRGGDCETLSDLRASVLGSSESPQVTSYLGFRLGA